MGQCSCFFFIDACGWEVIRDRPVILDLGGNARPLRSVLGYSSACVPSILSGLWPEEHLHWSFFTFPEEGTGLRVPWWIRALPPQLRDRGRVRRHLSRAVQRRNGIAGYFQMYQMPVHQLHRYGHCEPNDIFRPGGLNRGETIFDLIDRRGARAWCSHWHRSDDENWAAMESAASDPATGFLFIYVGGLDGWLHQHTRQSPLLEQRLGEIRARVDTVLSAARRSHDSVRSYFFSDHGMCTIRERLDVLPILERTGLRMHRDYRCVVDSTMVRVRYRDGFGRDAVRDALAGVPALTLLDEDRLRRERCLFPDARFGDDIWLVDPHVLIVPSHMGLVPLAGMHGYDPGHEDSYASFVSDDPDALPETIVDLHGLMADAIDRCASAEAAA